MWNPNHCIFFPTDVANIFQKATCLLTFSVIAVQSFLVEMLATISKFLYIQYFRVFFNCTASNVAFSTKLSKSKENRNILRQHGSTGLYIS